MWELMFVTALMKSYDCGRRSFGIMALRLDGLMLGSLAQLLLFSVTHV